MALKRYTGPFPAVEVRIAGEDFGKVAKGDAIAVPDDLANQVVWQDDLWEDGAAEKPAAVKADDKAGKDSK